METLEQNRDDFLPTTVIGADAARAAVERAIDGYLADRRLRIPEFTRRHFGVRGALRIHRRALGADLLRAPANVLLAVPALASSSLAFGMRKAGWRSASDWLGRRRFLMETDVAREIGWLVQTDLLELPSRMGDRESRRDALLEKILSDPEIDRALWPLLIRLGKRADDPAFRSRLEDMLVTYAGTRAAAAEIASSLASLGAGAIVFNKFTPGALSLGPALAAGLAHSMAVASFPLGGGLGAMWYGFFPAVASPALVAGMTGAVLGGMAVFAAFAGIVTDPVQKAVGLHQRRLCRLVGALETVLKGDGEGRLVVVDHYVARLLDLVDVLRAATRLA